MTEEWIVKASNGNQIVKASNGTQESSLVTFYYQLCRFSSRGKGRSDRKLCMRESLQSDQHTFAFCNLGNEANVRVFWWKPTLGGG